LLTGEHYHRPHAEEGDEDADSSNDIEELLQVEFASEIVIIAFFKIKPRIRIV
jgi:hypothetical protein